MDFKGFFHRGPYTSQLIGYLTSLNYSDRSASNTHPLINKIEAIDAIKLSDNSVV